MAISMVHSPVIIFGNGDKGLKRFYPRFITDYYPKPMNTRLLRKANCNLQHWFTMFNLSGHQKIDELV